MPQLTRKGTSWELLQSLYIPVAMIPFGPGCLAFLYVFLRARRFAWLVSFFIYCALWVLFYGMVANLPTDPSTAMSLAFTGYLGMLCIIPPIHAIIIRTKFLLILEARAEGANLATDRLRTEIRASEKALDNRVDEALIGFKEDDITVKLCRTLFGVLPFAPDFRFYFNLEGATRRLVFDQAEVEQVLERAKQIARQDDGIVSALKVARALDIADSGLGIVTGVRNVYDHMKDNDRKRTFEADPQQAADAALKAMGLAYMVSQLYPGSITEKIGQFFDSKAGQEIALYYAAAEVALPFTDNLLEGGGHLIADLIQKEESNSESRFVEFVGRGPLTGMKPIMEQMVSKLDAFAGQIRMYADPLLQKAKGIAPSILNIADSASGGAATAVDVLPAWQFLTARLAAEACVERARAELKASGNASGTSSQYKYTN